MMSTTTIDVRPAGSLDQQGVIDVITLAFASDPMTRWAFPDAATYLRVMPVFARAFGGNGFAHGTVHVVGGNTAAAMWLPPDVQPDVDQLMALAQEHIPQDRQPDLMRIFERMDAFHPTGPCWYLPLIGVDPAAQGRGYGSALLRYALERCDRDGIQAYLESSNPRNIPLYERHGFEVIGNIQEGSSPSLVPMLRRAR